jgi:hypothetical protein
MLRRDVTPADKVALLDTNSKPTTYHQPSPTGGDIWNAEMYNCTLYTAARETVR